MKKFFKKIGKLVTGAADWAEKTFMPEDPWTRGLINVGLGMIPGVGPALATGWGALGGYKDAGNEFGMGTLLGGLKGYGMGALGSGIAGSVGSVMGGLGQAGAGSQVATVLGQPVTLGQTIQGASPWAQISHGFGQGLTGYGATGIIPGVQSTSGLNIARTLGIGSGGGGVLGSVGGAAGGAGGGAAGGGGMFSLENLKNPMSLLGLGITAMGTLPMTTPPPQIGDVAGKWLTSDAITEAGKLAQNIQQTDYMGEFQPSNEIQAFIEVQGKSIDKAYKQRLEQMDKNMAAVNPQWRQSGERLEMIRRVQEEQQHEKDQMQSQWLLTAKQEHSRNQYNSVMTALQVDDSIKRELLYADVADLVWKYQVNQDDVLRLRQLAQDAGLYLTMQGMQQGAA